MPRNLLTQKETLPLGSRQPDCSRLSKQLWGPSVELNLQMSVAKIHCVHFDTNSILLHTVGESKELYLVTQFEVAFS